MNKKPRKFYPIDNARWEKFGTWLRQARKEKKLRLRHLVEESGLSMIQVFRIEHGKSSTTKASALTLGRIVGADDLTTLKMAGFEKAVTVSLPKTISDLVRTHGNKLSGDDFVSIANFVIERSKRNARKTRESGT